MSGFLTGMRRQQVQDANRDLAIYEAEIRKLRAQLAAEKEKTSTWRAHYAAEESRCAYVMEIADKLAGGADKNPARQTQHQNIRIESGSRKGQLATKADVVYFSRISGVCEKRPELGDWSTLIRDNQIFE